MKYDLNLYSDLLFNYFFHHKNINVPINYKVTLYDGTKLPLGYFVNSLRKKYRKGMLNPREIETFTDLNIAWNPLDDNWLFMYNLVKTYKDENNNINIKPSYKLIIDGKEIYLGRWLANQKNNYRNAKGTAKIKYNKWHLSDERIKMLEDLDIDWYNYDYQIWWLKYNAVLEFKAQNQSLMMPKNQMLSLSNGEKFSAYDWLIKNKIKYLENQKSLSVEQIEALKSIKIEEFGRIKYTWMMMYKEAEKYHEEFKNLKVPATYSYYDIQGNCVNLGNWINSQRKKYKNNTNPDNGKTCKQKLEPEEIELLNKIDMIWKIQISFAEIYPYLLAYYKHYGNLKVPYSFKTNDGYTYTDSGIYELAKWLNTFKHTANPLRENALILTKMGLVWPIKENREAIEKLCNQYGIDGKLNINVIKRTSYIEFVSKIEYLNDNNIPLTKNGVLNPIFSMSNQDILTAFKVTLEDILNNYYNKHLEKSRLLNLLNS